MKHLLLSIIPALLLPVNVKAEVSEEFHKRCLDARDYTGCIRTNQEKTQSLKREMIGIGLILSLNSDTAELIIQSVINNSPADDADMESGDVIIKIDGKSTKGMGMREAIKLIKGPKDKPIKLVIGRNIEKGKRKKIEVKLIRDTFLIPEEESLNQSNMKEFFYYGFPWDLKPMNPHRYYPYEKKKEIFPNSQI